jgi:hypothetical protein
LVVPLFAFYYFGSSWSNPSVTLAEFDIAALIVDVVSSLMLLLRKSHGVARFALLLL